MADAITSLSLDPRSLILSQFCENPDRFHILELKSDSFSMERGPRYKEYAARRESRLRMKQIKQSIPVIEEENVLISLSPPKKLVQFPKSLITPPRRTRGSSVLTKSVPDFSSVLRKENRKPPPGNLPPVMEKSMTPPLKSKSGKYDGILGSKSVNSGEKKGGGFSARKSYASFEEFKGLVSPAKNAVNLEAKGMKNTRITGRSTFAYRQFY